MAAYLFNNDFLITEAGEINARYVKNAARARAEYRYGATCTKFDIAYYEEKVGALAILQQAKFRDGLFIPADPFHFARQAAE